MTHVGFLSSHTVSSLPREEKAAWDWLRHSPMSSNLLTFQKVAKDPASLDPCQVLWWHSTEIPTPPLLKRSPEIGQALRTFCRKGGGLLLTLLAAPFVRDLGLEDIPPDRIVKGKWKGQTGMEGYPDIRGFHGFLNHPLFHGLHGGVYTWMPARGESYCEAVYSRKLNPRNGAVVALEWGRISFDEDCKCMIEYRIEKGTVLTIGTHLYFAPSINEFGIHRDVFLSNVFQYVTDPPPPALTFFPKRPIHAFPQ